MLVPSVTPQPVGMFAAQALVRWGGAMLELAHFKQGAEADDYIKEVSRHGSVK